MTLRALIVEGKAGGALVRVRYTGELGRIVRTPSGGVLVRSGSEPLTWAQPLGDVQRFDVDELELVPDREDDE